MAYQEGQRLQGSDGKTYVVQGGVPREEAASLPAVPRAPGVIPGRPDPYKQASEQRSQAGEIRAQEDQEFQRRKFEIEQDRADRAEEKASGGSADEKRIATLLTRIAGGAHDIQGLTEASPDAAAPGVVETLRGSLAPGGIGGMISRSIAGSERRSVHDAQRDVLDALLTLGTGAAYNAEQLDAAMVAHFPQYGEGAEESALKTQRLQRLIEAAKANAGPAWERVAPALAPLMQAPPPAGGVGGQRAEEPDGLSGSVTYDPAEWRDGVYVGPPEGAPGNLGPDGRPRVTGNDPGYMQIAAGVGDIVQGGLNNTVGLLANPVNTNLFRAVGYDGYTSDIGATAREALGLPYGNETIGAINQAASGGLGGAGAANALGRTATAGVARNALLEYGSRPLLDTVTGGAAAFSGEAARQMGAGPVGQTVATVVGGATPSGLMGARNALIARNVPPPDFDPTVVQAGARQNVPIRAGDALPSRRGETAALETSQRGGPIIQQARANDNALIEQRVDSLGGRGAVQDPYPLGQRVQRAGQRYIDRTRGQKNDHYTRAEQLANGQRIAPQQAIASVDRNIAELEASGANTNAATIDYLRQLREDLSKPEGFSITEFQALRSAAGKKIKGDQALTSSDADRRLSDVVRSFSADASEQLPDAASTALEQADTFYAQRQDFINGVLRNVMGTRGNPLPAERAASRLVAMTKGKGDFDRFSRMWGELTPDEKGDVAATIAQSLGRKANGEFSVSTLITSLDPKSGLNPRTARLIFGADGARALTDLRAIAQAKTGTAAALNNSRTGTVVNRVGSGLKTLLWGSLGLTAGGPAGAIAAPVGRELLAKWGEERAARALMNPAFTNWLREAPEASDPKAINAYWRRLETAAAKSPILAGDVRALQEALSEVFAQSPSRAAASQQEND